MNSLKQFPLTVLTLPSSRMYNIFYKMSPPFNARGAWGIVDESNVQQFEPSSSYFLRPANWTYHLRRQLPPHSATYKNNTYICYCVICADLLQMALYSNVRRTTIQFQAFLRWFYMFDTGIYKLCLLCLACFHISSPYDLSIPIVHQDMTYHFSELRVKVHFRHYSHIWLFLNMSLTYRYIVDVHNKAVALDMITMAWIHFAGSLTLLSKVIVWFFEWHMCVYRR